jgi:hypothetical protein
LTRLLRKEAGDVIDQDSDRLTERIALHPIEVEHGCQQDLRAAQTVAALYVDPNGFYANLPGVEVWDEARDARLYAGPWPVVAHPPCAAWSAWAGMREAVYGRPRGVDGGCFAAALYAVRRYGGVLEHPAHSKAWDAFDLPNPSVEGAWSQTLDGQWTCSFDQAAYGLRFNKHTWLYYVGDTPPDYIAWQRPHTGRGPDDVWSDARSRTSPMMAEYLVRLARLSREIDLDALPDPEASWALR